MRQCLSQGAHWKEARFSNQRVSKSHPLHPRIFHLERGHRLWRDSVKDKVGPKRDVTVSKAKAGGFLRGFPWNLQLPPTLQGGFSFGARSVQQFSVLSFPFHYRSLWRTPLPFHWTPLSSVPLINNKNLTQTTLENGTPYLSMCLLVCLMYMVFCLHIYFVQRCQIPWNWSYRQL